MRLLIVGKGHPYEVNTHICNSAKYLDIEYSYIDLAKFIPTGETKLQRLYIKIFSRHIYKYFLNNQLINCALRFKPDVLLVIKGAGIKPETLSYIKSQHRSYLINYATDDPFNTSICGDEIRNSISSYDVYFCTKRAIINDVVKAGCSEARYLPFGYQPDVHYFEKPISDEETKKYSSDVVLIGGCDEDRHHLINGLICNLDINLHLYGGYWNRFPEFKKYYRGFVYGRDYRLALSSTKIALGPVRHSNRDGHSPRTFEIIACNAFLLCEYTAEHDEIFVSDKEAVFYSSVNEMTEKIRYYLTKPQERKIITDNGYKKICENGGNTYLDRLSQMLFSL